MSKERSASRHQARPLPGHGAAPEGDRASDPGAAGPGGALAVAQLAAPRKSGRCTWQVVEGEAVLLDLRGKQLVGLNGVGSFVFGLLDGARTVAALSAAVAERFEVELARAEADVLAFVRDLARRGFVEGVET